MPLAIPIRPFAIHTVSAGVASRISATLVGTIDAVTPVGVAIVSAGRQGSASAVGGGEGSWGGGVKKGLGGSRAGARAADGSV